MNNKNKLGVKLSLVSYAVISGLALTSQAAHADDEAKEVKSIETITVTSRKREESILEVPMSVSSISAMEISDRNAIEIDDIYRTLAGGASPRGELILRGLSGGNSTAPGTTTTFTDDVPFSFSSLFDIERVEVLRGPQGTLYGSNAIGGTVRVLTKKPVIDEFELHGSMQIKDENNVEGYDTLVQMAVNIPLMPDTLALRMTGSFEHDDRPMVNVYTGNQAKAEDHFIRTQLMWKINEDFRANFTYVNTEFDSEGTRLGDRSKPGGYYEPVFSANEDAPYGYDVDFKFTECDADLERPACNLGGEYIDSTVQKYQVYDIIDGSYNQEVDLYSVTIEHDNLFDFATFTYAGSYREVTDGGLDNWSRLDLADMFRTWIINYGYEERTTHEIRFQNINVDDPLNWTIGYFYDKTEEPNNPDVQWQYHEGGDQAAAGIMAWWWGIDVTAMGQEKFGNPNKNWNLANIDTWEEESAFFADAAYVFDTELGEFEINGGIRFFDLEDYSHTETAGIWSENTTITSGEEDGDRKKFSVSWRPADNYSVYALYSEGYRPGGNNGPLAQSCSDDPNAGLRQDRYTSDSIDNYEIGFKASLFDGAFSFASAVYKIDWSDIKTSIYMDTCGFSFTANGGEAESKGIEFESTAQLTDTLSMLFNAAYTDAELTQDNDSIQGKAGDDMTMVPDYNVYLALDKSFDLFGRDANIRAEMLAYGDYKTHFNTLDADKVDAYQTFNLSGRLKVKEDIQLSVFVNNVFDDEDVLYKNARSRNPTSTAQQYIEYLPERNISVRIDYTFY